MCNSKMIFMRIFSIMDINLEMLKNIYNNYKLNFISEKLN